MKESIHVMYFGSDVNTAFLLAQDDTLVLKAVARNSSFVKHKSFNPVDVLFRTAYAKHYKNESPTLIKLYNTLFQHFSFLASPYYKKYKDYLDLLITQRISIINAKKHAALKDFVTTQDIRLFVINFWSILPKRVIKLPALGCVNIHPSKLPKYKGALPTLWALKHKDSRAAVTYMTIDETVDGGKVFAQHEFDIMPTDNSIDLEHKINTIISQTFIPNLKAYINKTLPLMDQEGKASKTALFERYRLVNFKKELAEDILNKVLIYNYSCPIVNCYALHRKRKIVLTGCRKIVRDMQCLPGSYKIKGSKLFVGCKDYTLMFKAGSDIKYIDFFWLLFNQLSHKEDFATVQTVAPVTQ